MKDDNFKKIDKIELKELYEADYSQVDLSREYGVPLTIIRTALSGIYDTTHLNAFRGIKAIRSKVSGNDGNSFDRGVFSPRSLRKYRIIKKLLDTTDTYYSIAKEEAVSREYVGQIADALCSVGIKLHSKRPRKATKGGPALTRGYVSRRERLPRDVKETKKETKSLLSKKEVADLLTVSTRSVERLVSKGELKQVKIGGCVRFKLKEVEAMLK